MPEAALVLVIETLFQSIVNAWVLPTACVSAILPFVPPHFQVEPTASNGPMAVPPTTMQLLVAVHVAPECCCAMNVAAPAIEKIFWPVMVLVGVNSDPPANEPKYTAVPAVLVMEQSSNQT
jgi:hypothetical protein